MKEIEDLILQLRCFLEAATLNVDIAELTELQTLCSMQLWPEDW
jgi:hypothetical protein